jgi:serine/threonine protein phosphatase PrpC
MNQELIGKGGLKITVVGHQLSGPNSYQEDRILADVVGDFAVWGIFDGHGGENCSQYCNVVSCVGLENFCTFLAKNENFLTGNIEDAIVTLFNSRGRF